MLLQVFLFIVSSDRIFGALNRLVMVVLARKFFLEFFSFFSRNPFASDLSFVGSVQLISDGVNIPKNALEIDVAHKKLSDCFFELLKAQGMWESGVSSGLSVLDLSGTGSFFPFENKDETLDSCFF